MDASSVDGSEEEEEPVKFKCNEIVWAKVKGHSWWPALVGNVTSEKPRRKERKYLVHFIGDDTRSLLTASCLTDFKPNFFQLAFVLRTKNKTLL